MQSFTRNLVKQTIDHGNAIKWAGEILQATNLQELVKQAVSDASRLFQCPICVLLLLEKDSLVIQSVMGVDFDSIEHPVLPLESSFSGRLARRGEPRLFRDLTAENQNPDLALEPYYSGSLASAPLAYNYKLIGLLNVCDPSSRKVFNHEDLNRLVTYCNQLAFAITSQKLVQERTIQLESVNEKLLREINERKRIEEELRDGEELLRATLESTGDGILVVNREGRVTNFNSRFAEIWKIPEQLLMTRDDDKLIDHVLGQLQDPDAFVRKVRELYDSSSESFDTLHFKDGRIFERYSCPLIRKNEASGRVWSFRNITERRNAEQESAKLKEQLQQSQKMEAIGRLAGGVAHDFNNILTGIMGYAQMIISELSLSDPILTEMEEILRASERAGDLTQQLLAFSRKQIISPKILNLNETIGQSQKMLTRIIGEDIDLAFLINQSIWSVKADPGQIEQILVNLAANARDAMPEGGKLTIETKNIFLDSRYCKLHSGAKPGEYVMMAVSDNGCGMDEETLSCIFEPFFSTKDKDKGTGLGLATVYGIVKQNDGYISVYSEKGIGTTFKIYFPRVEQTPRQFKETKAKILPTGTETILLVEDEEVVRGLAKRILQKHGYKVLEANDGQVALSFFKQYDNKIDLLLSDVIMPNMNGRQLYENLIRIRPDIKVLYMSGYTENAIAHHGVLDEGTNFIQKPFSIESLAVKVREVLDS